MNSKSLSYSGTSGLSPFQVLARVHRDTGIRVSMSRDLLLEEDLTRVISSSTMVKLGFSVKKYTRTRQGRKLVETGVRACALVRVGDAWSVLADMTQTDVVEEQIEEIYHGRVESPDEAMERIAYEEMCFRPGSARNPMDTASRVRQKKRLGI